MRKIILPIFMFSMLVLALSACNSNRMTDKQIDSLNKASADSLLKDALEDTTALDNLKTDSVTIEKDTVI